MNLVRKHKISLITNEPLSGRDKEIIDFIEDILSNIILFKHDAYPNSTFFMKDGKVLLEQNTKYDRLWCKYDDFWKDLRYNYDMNVIDIQTTIKYMVEQAFKIKVGTPDYVLQHKYTTVEQAFKRYEHHYR